MNLWFNELEPYPAQWLRNLWPDATVNEGDIRDLEPSGITSQRAHFFAGIGGWEYALQLAGWADDRPVWTGSCPCQPFSNAGKRRGASDARNLWPDWFRLIQECRPPTIFGEQVASRLGREWLSGVFADLESVGYAVAGADLCAAGVGAPHIRQRLWWVAHRASDGLEGGGGTNEGRSNFRVSTSGPRRGFGDSGAPGGVGDPNNEGPQGRGVLPECTHQCPAGAAGVGCVCWQAGEWVPCADGKARRIEPGLEPLAHGVPARVGRLRAYGNAIVPQVAATFVRACMEACDEST